ncbi:MAG: orotate phosphoribosyltransferase [Spirochaetaceae bacterium]|jgi:orotate phosphoribosyltransferase|nr:orotate phosphoribosyltransferase [Spirochaetaceae bacterium]
MNTITLLKESKALLEGHFLLSSGRHSNRYFQCARLLQYPDKAEAAVQPLAARLNDDIAAGTLAVDAIVGPALGGIIVAYELGRQLRLPAFFTERDDSGAMTLRRGFEVHQGMCILIAEDVITTGKSSLESIKILEHQGAKVTALSCIVDRRAAGVELPLPLYAAVKLDAANWSDGDCPLCKQGGLPVKPGSRPL